MPEFRWNLNSAPVRYQTLDENQNVPMQPEQGFLGNLADAYGIGIWGQIKDAGEQVLARARGTNEANFDPLTRIPKGYEQYADSYAWAYNQAEIDTITSNIDENNAIRMRQSELGTGSNLMYGLISGIVDPMNFLPVPGLKGLGFVKGGIKGGLVIGSINAAQEIVRNDLDPTSTNTETAFNIGINYLLAGLISGGIGHFTGRNPGDFELSAETQVRVDKAANGYAEAQAAVDGLAVKDVIDFNGQGVRIIEGNTGKVDSVGNYVRAFFRPKEALEAAAYREKVASAADSALGDVIPDRTDLGDEAVAAADEVMAAHSEDAGPAMPSGGAADNAMPDGAGQGADAATPPKVEGAPEDTIFIDTAAILSEFEGKPWTSPRTAGIEPLAEDAFKSPEEWLNFVVLHELNHKTTKILPGEGKVAYENRINRLAFDEVKAGRMPLSPTDSALEKLMLLPTPSGTLMRLAPRQREVHELAQGIAGDMSTMTIANRMGRATTPGGSVYQRAQRWLVSNYATAVEWQKAYVRYITGAEVQGTRRNAVEVARIGMPFNKQRKGKLTPAQFREYVGRAVYDDQPFELHGLPLADADMEIVRGAAREIRKVFGTFEAKARDLGMFEAQSGIKREIDWQTRANERDAARLEKLRPGRLKDEISADIAARTAKLEELQGTLEAMASDPIKPAREDFYFPRIYDIGKIKANYDAFVARIGESFGGGDEALVRAREVADRIIGNGGEEFIQAGTGGPRNLLGREIPLTNRELSDFIVHDVEMVMGIYSRRMGASIEMTAKYGSRMLGEHLDNLKATLVDAGTDPKTTRKILEEVEDMRDRVLGRFHAKDPMSWDNRVARVLKNFANITVMGKAILAQTMDVARTVATEGHGPLFKAMHAAFKGETEGLSKGVYAKEAGEALELVNARWMAQLIDNDSALTITNQTALERGLAAAQAPFFQLNLMNPFTTIWKDFTSLMSSHVLLSEAQTVASAVRAGRTLETFSKAERRMAERLASWGVDLRAAQMIADMPYERSAEGSLIFANLEKWTGRDGEHAREVFLGALGGNLRSSVVTPGPLQRAAIMDGVFRINGKRYEQALLSLPFQLMSFTMSSSAKLTHALLSGRDRSRAVSLSALMIGGAVTTWLKAVTAGNWEYMEWDDFAIQTLENSGVAGWLGDVTKRFEDLTGIGPRSALEIKDLGEDTVSDEIGSAAGVAPGVIAGFIEAFVSDNPDLEDGQRARLIRRAIPFNNLVFLDSTFKEMTNWAVDAGLIDGPVVDLPEGEAAEAEAVQEFEVSG